jgi:hypothetical protein
MLVAAIKKNFPKGVAVPDELEALCRFAEDHNGALSGWFRLKEDGRESALTWFDDDSKAASQFAAFARCPDGSLYALWMHAGKDASQAPVVLLDSEAQQSKVIAGNCRDFLRLLAMGYNEPGRYPTLEPDDPHSASDLREWLKAEFNLIPPTTGADLVAKAQSGHPDLLAWIREWQKRHFREA